MKSVSLEAISIPAAAVSGTAKHQFPHFLNADPAPQDSPPSPPTTWSGVSLPPGILAPAAAGLTVPAAPPGLPFVHGR